MNERAKKNLYCPIVQLAEHRSLKPLYPSEGGSLGSSPSGAAIFLGSISNELYRHFQIYIKSLVFMHQWRSDSVPSFQVGGVGLTPIQCSTPRPVSNLSLQFCYFEIKAPRSALGKISGSSFAGIVQWQYFCLPSRRHGFKSRYLLQLKLCGNQVGSTFGPLRKSRT